jgi:hypothetical protein
MQEQVTRLADASIPASLAPDRQQALAMAVRDSFVLSFRMVMLLCAVVAVGGAISAALTIKTAVRR